MRHVVIIPESHERNITLYKISSETTPHLAPLASTATIFSQLGTSLPEHALQSAVVPKCSAIFRFLLFISHCYCFSKVNVRNRHRETPLLLAVRSDSEDTVSVLLSYGARLNEPDVNGKLDMQGMGLLVKLAFRIPKYPTKRIPFWALLVSNLGGSVA